MMRQHNDQKFLTVPNTIPWPPVLLLLAIGLALALARVLPLGFAPPLYVRGVGLVVALAGLTFDIWAILTMKRGNTNILPHRAASRLITHGPFNYSRNPIYLGNVLLCAGLAFVLANPWLLLTGAGMAVAVDRLAIRREEIHLAHRFGEHWDRYKARTRRWFWMVSRSRKQIRESDK